MRFVISLSRILNHVLVNEIGRCCAGALGLLGSLGSSTIVASPMVSGTSLVSHMFVMSLCVISMATSPPACIASALMLSGPGALPLARRLITLLISALDGGSEVCVFD